MKTDFYLEDNLIINTKRLALSKCNPSRISELYLTALNDNKVIQYTEARHCNWDKETAAEFISLANQKKSILFEVNLKKSSKPIGNIRFFNWHKIHRRVELSFLFYDKLEWGKGYATEAIEAALKYGKEKFDLHRITADYYACNKASEKVFSKLQFEIEGIFKDHFWLNDHFVDSIRVGKIL